MIFIKFIQFNFCQISGLWQTNKLNRLLSQSLFAKLIFELKNIDIHVENIDIGGGLGIKYTNNDIEPDLQEYCSMVSRILGNLNCRIIFEPGRYIVGNSGILVTKVLYKKRSQNKKFLVTDAGMNDFSRTALYGAAHRLIPISKKGSVETDIYDVVGPVCETTDTFLKNYFFLNPKP